MLIMTAADGVLDGQMIISRIVEPDDVVIMIEDNDMPVLEAVGMLTMAIDTLLHVDDHEQ